jgi:hypothetical protein
MPPLNPLAGSSSAQTTEKEKVVMAYYSGFEKKDWNAVSAQFADGFTFTSPNNDDHISVDKFKEKCFGTAKFVKKVNYIKMVENADDLMLLVQITTTDDNVVRNVDVFNFSSTGKIKSIEVFFGAGTKYPGNKQ